MPAPATRLRKVLTAVAVIVWTVVAGVLGAIAFVAAFLVYAFVGYFILGAPDPGGVVWVGLAVVAVVGAMIWRLVGGIQSVRETEWRSASW